MTTEERLQLSILGNLRWQLWSSFRAQAGGELRLQEPFDIRDTSQPSEIR
jgi:hypothetical protein